VYSQNLSGTSAVTATGATGSSPAWASVLALFTAKTGFTPAVINQATLFNGAFNSFTNIGIGFTPTAGNTLVVAIFSSNTSLFGGSTSVFSFTDSKGDLWTQLVTSIGTSGSGEQVILLGAENITGGATTFSCTLSRIIANADVLVIEISNLVAALSKAPTFRPLTSLDIPPINLTKNNANGGVTGILGTGNLPATVAYTNVANNFTAAQTLTPSSSSVVPLNVVGNAGTLSEIDTFANLRIRYDVMPGGLASPWTSYSAAIGGDGTHPILALAPASGGTPNLLDAYAPGSTTVKNFSIASSGKVSNYNGIATVSDGVPAEYATVDLTAQAAAITATTLYAVPAAGAGMYRVSWVAKVTTPATASSTLGGTNGFQLLYTDQNDSVVVTTPAWWGGGNNGAAPTSASAALSAVPRSARRWGRLSLLPCKDATQTTARDGGRAVGHVDVGPPARGLISGVCACQPSGRSPHSQRWSPLLPRSTPGQR